MECSISSPRKCTRYVVVEVEVVIYELQSCNVLICQPLIKYCRRSIIIDPFIPYTPTPILNATISKNSCHHYGYTHIPSHNNKAYYKPIIRINIQYPIIFSHAVVIMNTVVCRLCRQSLRTGPNNRVNRPPICIRIHKSLVEASYIAIGDICKGAGAFPCDEAVEESVECVFGVGCRWS